MEEHLFTNVASVFILIFYIVLGYCILLFVIRLGTMAVREIVEIRPGIDVRKYDGLAYYIESDEVSIHSANTRSSIGRCPSSEVELRVYAH